MLNMLLTFGLVAVVGVAGGAPLARERAERGLAGSSALANDFEKPQVWTTLNGLPHNSVQALLQTHDGYLWIATPAGLARFDGSRFTRFDHSNVPVMVSDDCTSLSESEDGTLWIGTTQGLLRLHEGAFTLLTEKDGLLDDRAWAVCASRAGGVWVSSRDGVVRWDQRRVAEFHFQDPASRSETALFEDSAGAVWFDRRGSTARVSPEGRMEAAPHEPLFGSRCFYQDQVGTLWTGSDALLRWTAGQTRPEVIWNRPDDAGLVSAIAEDADGALWFGFQGGGAYRLHDGRVENINTKHGLSDNLVTALRFDREGTLWIGTEQGGLNRLRSRSLGTLGLNDGLAQENVWTILQTRDGAVWCGSDGGLSRWAEGEFTNYSETERLSKNAVRALCEDRASDLWIGTGDGLNRFREGRFTRVRVGNGPGSNKIRAICEDHEGRIWVGTAEGVYRGTNGEFTAFDEAGEFGKSDVRAIHEDRSGEMWFAIYGGGLLQIQSGQRRVFTAEQGLSGNFVLGIFEDDEGVLWIGTERGLNRFKDGQLFAYSLKQGLFDGPLNFLLDDRQGSFWLSTESGIYRVRRKELNDVAEGRATTVTFAHYGMEDGMISAETNGQKSHPAGCRTRDGNLWFPTTQGVVVVDPKKLARDEPPPPVLIEEMRADGEAIFANAWTDGALPHSRLPAVRNQEALPDSEFRTLHALHRLLPGRGKVLEFHYTANSFVGADKIRFRYRLEGYDTDWIDAGPRRVAYYTNLRPRPYRFQVIACNSHGVWNEAGASLTFGLTPYFYQTGLFYTASALALILSGYGLHRWAGRRQRALFGLQRKLSLERERVRIARDLHDSLGASLTQIALLSESPETVAGIHAAYGPGAAPVATKAREAIRDLNELVWVVNPRNDTLEQFADYLCQYTESFFVATPTHVRLNLPTTFPPWPLSAEVRHHLASVLKEAMNNVAKHANATEVGVRLHIEGKVLTLCVEDNGRGFGPDFGEAAKVTRTTGGNGLINMRQRIEQVGGKLLVENPPAGGTRIAFRIPLSPQEHEP